MQVTVQYSAQVKRATGASQQTFELEDGVTVEGLLRFVGGSLGEEVKQLLLTPDGCIQPTLLLFVCDKPVDKDTPLKDNDIVTLLSPISGG